MKNLFLIVCLFVVVAAFGQNKKQTIIEKRARELHSTIGLTNKDQWKKFMQENYSKAMLERPVTTKTRTNDSEVTTSTSAATADQLEEKVKMFERLHSDFGNSKILSLKSFDERVEMVLENTVGLKGNFNITYEKESPFLINRIAVEINQR